MPPHCDSLDGPVVNAARRALADGDVRLVLPFAPEAAEGEIRNAFQRAAAARRQGGAAAEVAELWFFETAVRLHRAGEGAPFEGLKPAGRGFGPVIPRVEEALELGRPDEVIAFLRAALDRSVRDRFESAMALKRRSADSLRDARAYTSAVLGFEVFAHHLYAQLLAEQHARPQEAAPALAHAH